jgi:hypothetical protein
MHYSFSTTLYEWIDPNTEQGHGAFPFRTGISTMRVMVTGFLFKVMREYSPSSSSLQQFLDDTSQKNCLVFRRDKNSFSNHVFTF